MTQYPKPQRQTKKQHTQGQFRQMTPNHPGNNQPQQSNHYQAPHNTTTYMDLPYSIQNKICGRCRLMGHIKKFCKEEVYCKYCKVYTHSTTACRTYPATSSRKNTPEKRTPEDIDQEVNRRVQEQMLCILNDLSMNQQIATGSQGTTHSNQNSTQAGVPTKVWSENTPYQHIPEQRQGIQNTMSEFQRPSEVVEQEHSESGNTGQIRENHNQEPILNQQWDEPLHLQPPMRPTSITTSQSVNGVTNTTNPNATVGVNVEILATHRRVEMSMEEDQGRQSNQGGSGVNTYPNVTTTTTNQRVDQNTCTHCNCHQQLARGARDANATESQRLNVHTEYEDRNNGASKFFRGKRQTGESDSRECQIIRILPDENDDYMDIVRECFRTDS